MHWSLQCVTRSKGWTSFSSHDEGSEGFASGLRVLGSKLGLNCHSVFEVI